jgi:hypothetical protein
MDEQYAIQIARDWNIPDGGTGCVLRFAADGKCLSRCQVESVGSRMHREYWIPAAESAQINQHIVPPIEVVGAFKASADDERLGNQGRKVLRRRPTVRNATRDALRALNST